MQVTNSEGQTLFLYVCLIHAYNTVHAQLRPHVQLQPHQQEGIEQMIYMERAFRGGILADDVSSITIQHA